MAAWRLAPNVHEMQTVLIASQDAEMIRVWEALFEHRNCCVISECSTHNALQTARLLSPALIILALDLPDDERLSLCRDLRATTSGTLLLLAPRRSDIETSVYHFAGVNEIIPAPISPMALLIKSMAWLAREEWFVPYSQPEKSYL